MRRYVLRNMLVYDTKGQQSHVQGRRKGRGYWGVGKRSGGNGVGVKEVEDNYEEDDEDDDEVHGEEGGGEADKTGEGVGREEGRLRGMDMDDIPPLLPQSSHHVHHHHQRNLENDGEESDEDLNSYTPSRPFPVPITPAKPSFQPDIHTISTFQPKERGFSIWRGNLSPRERRVVLGELSKDDPRLGGLEFGNFRNELGRL